ncbi:uncharacterized protein LOC128118296 isoform X2 [Peromyscus californicus insignis]|uniref:uncharacterized protein LOC128118296 isoform X2 n=1 Tax=Peromyscus californicus insignis TaxID=564181 RepID=UPI0022A6C2F7|nr:uncharacterized protein LOC128118296 isoform X2 [Peromyscus californicus insignis]
MAIRNRNGPTIATEVQLPELWEEGAEKSRRFRGLSYPHVDLLRMDGPMDSSCVQVPDAASHPRSCLSPVDVTYFGKGSLGRWVWWYKTAIPATGRWMQEDQEFKIILITKQNAHHQGHQQQYMLV